jgi:predicted ATP-dependent endonuclease of OLD family
MKLDLRSDSGSSKNIIVFAGVNGSGKTSILEYIHKKSKSNKFDVKGDFTVLTEFDKAEGEERLLREVSTLRVDAHLSRMLDSGGDDASSGTYFDGSGELKAVSLDKIPLFKKVARNISDKIIYLKTESFHYNISSLIYEYVHGFVFKKNEKPEVAYNVVRDIMNDIFIDFDLKFEFGSIEATSSKDGANFNVFFRNHHSDRIKMESLSTGEKELITKAFYLEVLKPYESIVLIDEPERSLHPKWQQNMISVYERLSKKYGCQFIVATHSPHIISSVNPTNVYVLSSTEGMNENIEVQNLKDMQQYSLGLEPNRVLKEIMGLDDLRPVEIEMKINRLSKLLNIDAYAKPETTDLLNELTGLLGENDPFVIRANHRILVLERKRVLS